MDFTETKQVDRDAFEHHPNHCHMEREGSETHRIHQPAASYQHTVLRRIMGKLNYSTLGHQTSMYK